MEYLKKYAPTIFIVLLYFSAIVIWCFVYLQENRNDDLKVVFLDVGQGDSIYIEAPNGKQMLLDAGSNSAILSQLSKVMPFGDKSIDVVIITNPDTDHMGGVVDILQNYKVDMILESGTHSDTVTYRTLSQLIAQNKIQKKFARKGMRLVLDNKQNIYFDILFPDRDVSTWERNDGSVVGKLVYGTSSFMLMGDATKYTELLIAYNENPQTLNSQVLKLGHHGSHTSSSLLWLEKVKPEIAIVSAGLNNRYGHPHKDVIQRLSDLGIAVFGTYEKGAIMFKTNGVKLWQ